MRSAFEAWAQRDGHIVRRREDKPDEYLVFETQRRWVIWQAALAHGKTAAATAKFAAQKVPAREQAAEPADKAATMAPDEASVRNKVLNEVLDAFSDLDESDGIEGVLKVIQGLKKKQKVLAEDKAG
ncbi:hypothetical protein HHL21_13865 [Massilia sp. RP-1-19]|uniref:Uncharacterized protein n=1 Tax=Massilia polaris TaxID=2728846 RepID=A0A848HLS4_9BURK|nr:hypothetical protein [Massilia polaris]NML62142.1 hypothetical protein [Massilia polaris]